MGKTESHRNVLKQDQEIGLGLASLETIQDVKDARGVAIAFRLVWVDVTPFLQVTHSQTWTSLSFVPN